MVTALIGGAVADAADRRRVALLAELALAVVVAGLVANALLPHPRVWPLFAAAAATAALEGLQRPSLEALLPRVVDRDDIPAAVALSSLVSTIAFVVSLGCLQRMTVTPPAAQAERASLRGIATGWRYARSRPELMGSYLVDVNAMLFGMPLALFPAVAQRYGGPSALGVLYASPAIGAMVVSAGSGWVARVHRHGRAIALAAADRGAGIVAFGFASSLWAAVLALVVAGGADMVSGLFRSTLWNQTIPDHLRGRLAGIEMLSYSSGPALGNTEAGLVASVAGVRASAPLADAAAG